MQFDSTAGPTAFTWDCFEGCPRVEDETNMTGAQCRARALRHAERTGHRVGVYKTTLTRYAPSEG